MVSRVMQGGNASLAGDTAFPPGSTVEFKTVLGGLITGQVGISLFQNCSSNLKHFIVGTLLSNKVTEYNRI